jgi:ppGpp synthetase/RelA/SpoT-type nucleotidyltranferase
MLYAETLQKILYKIAKKYSPQAIVQSRPKAIASFAEKIYRKKGESSDPVHQFTDLCGGRIITSTHDEVAAISKYLEENFDIDWENSVDVSQRLKPTEFGYRSIHYIVSFKPGAFPDKAVDVPIPEEVYGLKAEVQVRTLLEHVWADFSHDLSYKRGFSLPKKWERELAGLAAMLENADGTLIRIRDGMKIYAACYGAYMDAEKMEAEMDKLEAVLEYDKDNSGLADRIGQLAMELGDNKKAVDLLSKYASTGQPDVLRDLGISLCRINKDNHGGAEYRKGQECLERACASSSDVRSLAAYAESWAGIDDDKAREIYGHAYDIDPSDPFVLCNYLEHEIAYKKDVSVIGQVRSNIWAAIDICDQQIDINVNLPWAYYHLGKLYLFLGMPYESLTHYAKAIQLSAEPWMIDQELQAHLRLKSVHQHLTGYDWIRRLLTIGIANLGHADPKMLSSKKPIEGPVIIVAGGCNIGQWGDRLMKSFDGFRGTILSSGLERGIGGFVGEVGASYDGIKTIGYMPKLIPSDMVKDRRYKEFRYTESECRYIEDNGFCALEALEKWSDIIASGIRPSDVKVIGFGGGRQAAVEYRLALALGAHVALLEGSGNEAARLAGDDRWKSPNGPISLPDDTMTMHAFIGGRSPIPDPIMREKLGRRIHEIYWDNQFQEKVSNEESMKKWDRLLPYLKESNRQQADDMIDKLEHMGFIVSRSNNGIKPIEFTKDEIEPMAEMEHGRWNAERLMDGWKLGKVKDVPKKISPYLVSWDVLPDNVKEWDRQAVREIPGLLAGLGYEVRRS